MSVPYVRLPTSWRWVTHRANNPWLIEPTGHQLIIEFNTINNNFPVWRAVNAGNIVEAQS
jgi:hypothetical protein